MRKTIIAGNWKLNGSTELCKSFAQPALDHTRIDIDVVICPPAVWSATMIEALNNSRWAVGAQSIAAEQSGAFTGEIAAQMFADLGVKYSIVGHSERRALFGETDQIVAKKTSLALEAGLTPILCVGEDLACREAEGHEQFVQEQLLASLAGLTPEQIAQVVIAYEPIWAIGTGKTASAEQAQAMHAHIRRVLASKVDSESISLLYGGSVKADNAKQLLAQPDIDGALVGGASLKVSEFLAIVESAV